MGDVDALTGRSPANMQVRTANKLIELELKLELIKQPNIL
jgi:hypothetical protein